MNESLGQRIKRFRAAAGLSQAQLAEACGWKSQSRVGNYEKDTREPSLADIEAMAEALRVDPSLLMLRAPAPAMPAKPTPTVSTSDQVKHMLTKVKGLTAEARLRIEAAALEPSDLPLTTATRNVTALRGKPDEIVIPQYDVRAAMGHGQVPSDYNQAIRNIIVSADLLQEKGVTYTQPTSLAIVTGWGQSMEGTINDKDPVIVDRGVTEYVGEGVYLVTWLGELFIKRLQRMDEEHMWLISDNKKHKDQTARIDDLTIHAKVLLVWNAKRL